MDSYIDRLTDNLKKYKDRCAIDYEGIESPMLMYEDLYTAAAKLARKLQSKGLKKGDVVKYYGMKSPGYYLSMIGVWMAGGVFCDLNTQVKQISILINAYSDFCIDTWFLSDLFPYSGNYNPISYSDDDLVYITADEEGNVVEVRLNEMDSYFKETSLEALLNGGDLKLKVERSEYLNIKVPEENPMPNGIFRIVADTLSRNEGYCTTVFNSPLVFDLTRYKSVETIKEAVMKLIRVHPVISMRIFNREEDGELYIRNEGEWRPDIDVYELDKEPDDDYYAGFIKPFDLLNEHLARFSIHLYDGHIYLFWDLHHCLHDAHSTKYLIKDFFTILDGNEPVGEFINIYTYAYIESVLVNSSRKDKGSEYYKRIFDEYRYDVFKPDLNGNANEGSGGIELDSVPLKSVDYICRTYRISMANLMLAALFKVLAGHSSHKKLLINELNPGRESLATIRTVACFASYIPICCEVDERSVAEIARDIAQRKIRNKNNMFDFGDHYSHLAMTSYLDGCVYYNFLGDHKIGTYARNDDNDNGTPVRNVVYNRKKFLHNALSFCCEVTESELRFFFSYNKELYSKEMMSLILGEIKKEVYTLIPETLSDPANELEYLL